MPRQMNSRLFLSVSAFALAGAANALAPGAGSTFIIDLSGAQPTPPANSLKLAPEKPAAPAVDDFAAARSRDSGWAAQKPDGFVSPLAPILGEGAGPDETALRYYAAMNQPQRVKTEMDRLLRLYPDWTPPNNLYEISKISGDDEQQYWDLFSADRMDELRDAISARQRDEPGWKPSDDLASKIRSKSLRVKIMELWKTGKLVDLTDFVKAEGFGGDDADVDVLWLVAESYARTKQTTQAVDIFKKILNVNKDAGQRLATIQKAMTVLRMTDVEPLIAMERVGGNGVGEFSSISIDITRARISAFLHDERTEEIAPRELAAFEDYARGANDPNQPGLVAWYYYKTKVFRSALDWFKFALEHGGDAMIAHGLAHSLRELGRYRETEEVAYAWRDPLINNAILFIDILERDLTKEIPPYIEPERLLRYAQVTMDLSSGEGAQGLAWYAYNSCQYDVAYEWFKRANAWSPKEGTAYGLASAARKVGKSRDFVDIVNRYDGLFPKVVELVFPDNLYHPPSPCDLLKATDKDRQRMIEAAISTSLANGGASALDPSLGVPPAGSSPYAAATRPYGGYPAQQSQPALQARAPYGQPVPWSPTPGQQQFYGYRVDQPPVINRAEFPIAVNPENPLRYSSSGKLMTAPAQLGRLPPPPDMLAAPEPWRGVQPLVAWRVPGVGAMPYERYGFSLLAGWTGVLTAGPAHNAETAPAGTLWATEQTADAQATRGSSAGQDALRQDPYSLLQAISGTPRVPPPMSTDGVPLGYGGPTGSIGPLGAQPPQPLTMASIANPAPALPTPPSAPRADETALDEPARRALRLYRSGDYAGALGVLDARGGMSRENDELRMVRAWSLMHLSRQDEARAVFASLDNKTGAGSAPGKTSAAKTSAARKN